MAVVTYSCTKCKPVDTSVIEAYMVLVNTTNNASRAEASRASAETDRAEAEAQRSVVFASDHSRAMADHSIAQSDHEAAGADHASSVAATASAVAAAALAGEKAELVQTRLDTADADHTRADGDHSTAVSDHSTALSDHTVAQSDHATAGTDHAQAASDHSTAASDHTDSASATAAATGAAELANTKAALVQDKLDVADADHSRAEADHTLAASDHTTASSDHTQASADHAQASTDHTTASADHTAAASDHTQAASDHTLAAADHTTAGADHTQALADHEVMAGYDTRLTEVEGDVTELEAKVTGLGLPIAPTWQREGYYIAQDGTVTSNANFNVSAPITLEKGHTIIVRTEGSSHCIIAETDENGASYNPIVNASSLTTGVKLYRYSVQEDTIIAVSVKTTGEWSISDSVDGLVKDSEVEKKAIEDTMVSPNKFDRFSILFGGMYAVNASWMSNNSYYSSNFIPVMPGDVVKIDFAPLVGSTKQGNWTAFKSDKVTSAGGGQANIPMSAGTYELTVPTAWSETRYIAIGFIYEVDASTIVVTVNGKTSYKVMQSAVEGLETALNGKQNTLTAGDNIAIENNVISTKTGVLVNESQPLTETQKETARENIDAASEGEITYVNTAQVNATIGFANWAYGYVKPNGTIQEVSSGSWRYSDKIPIVPDTPIVVNKMYCNTAVTSVASYDVNDNFIAECSLSQSSSISSTNPVTIQTTGKNVAYIRITIGGGYPYYDVTVTQYSGVKTIKEVIAEVQEQIEGIEEELDGISVGTQWNGKSWVALGTSITDTKNTLAPDGTTTGKFVPYLAALSGLVVTDKGVAGSVIGGHILYYAGHTAETANADIITIEGGVNDWAGSRPLGQVGDTVPYLVEWSSPVWNNGGSADGTFAGACYQAIKTAMDNSPKAVVVVITDNTGQHIVGTGANCAREQANSLGLRQKDYTDMLIAVANYIGVPVINAGQRSMINQDNPDYLIDQIHQTELGGEQFANVIWSELKNFPCRITE